MVDIFLLFLDLISATEDAMEVDASPAAPFSGNISSERFVC